MIGIATTVKTDNKEYSLLDAINALYPAITLDFWQKSTDAYINGRVAAFFEVHNECDNVINTVYDPELNPVESTDRLATAVHLK